MSELEKEVLEKLFTKQEIDYIRIDDYDDIRLDGYYTRKKLIYIVQILNKFEEIKKSSTYPKIICLRDNSIMDLSCFKKETNDTNNN